MDLPLILRPVTFSRVKVRNCWIRPSPSKDFIILNYYDLLRSNNSPKIGFIDGFQRHNSIKTRNFHNSATSITSPFQRGLESKLSSCKINWISSSSISSKLKHWEEGTFVEGEIIKQQNKLILTPSTRAILKQTDKSLSELEKSLKLAFEKYEKIEDNPSSKSSEIKKSLEDLLDCFMNISFWEDALRVEQNLLDQDGILTSNLDIAFCIFRQGKLYVRMGETKEGQIKYDQAFQLFKKERSEFSFHADLGNVMVAKAGIQFELGNYDKCLEILQTAEPHFRKHGLSSSSAGSFLDNQEEAPHKDLVKCLDNQGLIYRIDQNFQGALEKYREALSLLDDNDSEREQTLSIHIADMLAALGEFNEAIDLYESIMEKDKNIRANEEEETALDGVLLQSVGKIHAQQGKHELALKELTKAYEIKKRFGGESNPEVADTLISLGAVHGVIGNKREALECFKEALVIQRAHTMLGDTDPQIVHIMRNIAILKGEQVPKWEEEQE